MGKRTLGLDLGANSIGWALVDVDEKTIIDAGVRVFPEGVDNFDTKKEKSKSEARRIARGMRRQIARRSRRKRKLREALVEAGLWPADAAEQQRLEQLDPYVLRRRALDEPFTPHEFGRVLLHLNQRRGFLSNRKTDRERKAETKGMLAEISQLEAKIEEAGCRTLGEYLCGKTTSFNHKNRAENDHVRHRHTLRAMYQREFDAVWEAQRPHHGDILTDTLRERIHRRIFFQRKMYWPASVVGHCELEPKQKRCPRADRLAQRFRLLQEVNNLRYIEPVSRDECRLDEQQRTLLIAKLCEKKEMTFNDIRKALNFPVSIAFNLERGKRTKLLGMVTDALMAGKSQFGLAWHKRPEGEKDEIVRTLIHAEDAEVRRRAVDAWGASAEVAEVLAEVDLPSGYLQLSRMALEKLVPHMERGLLYMTDDNTPSALSEAGYLRRDQIKRPGLDALPEPPLVTNPVVRQALHEVRKVVNAILREYGKPDRIHIELARNAKATSEERKRIGEAMREREALRDAAADQIREHGVKVTRDAINRYLLWQEQRETCPYSGRPISVAQLLSGTGEIDVDHILPYSRCLDDSMVNKVVCFRTTNHDKGQQTPYEWLAERQNARFEEVCQHVASLSYNKRKRFTQKTLDLDHFIQRQLNDTRYISRAVLEYVRPLVEEPHHAFCVKGEQTATLRRHWGLNGVLRRDDVDLKSRDDHRHHAVDAIVIALTDQVRLGKLAELGRRGGEDATGEVMLDPWETFRDDVASRVNAINVSHRPRRKIVGALHEDTLYGPTNTPGEYAVRKPVESLTLAMINDIRDETIRNLVVARLREHGVEHGRGKKAAAGGIPKEVWKTPLVMPSGVPVKRVRLAKRDQSILPLRGDSAFVKPGSVHHVCIFEFVDKKGKSQKDAVFVTMLEAIQRVKLRETIIQRTHPDYPDARFLMSLSAGEMVSLCDGGTERLYRFETAASTSKQMWFRHHTAGGKSSDNLGVVSKKPNTFVGRKVTVDPLGRVRWAND